MVFRARVIPVSIIYVRKTVSKNSSKNIICLLIWRESARNILEVYSVYFACQGDAW